MRRSTIITAAVVFCLFAQTSASFAGNRNNDENHREKKNQNRQKFALKGSMPGQMLRQSLLAGNGNQGNGNHDSNQKHAKHNKRKTHNRQDDNINNIIPLDPGRGDGRVPVAPVISTPPARPGFVWTGDHWERARATSRPILGTPPVANGGGGVTVTPANSGPVIRDHRQGVVTVTPVPINKPPFASQLNNPPPVVLNPPMTQSTPPRGSGGRPRFDQNRAPGGVTVSVVPGSQRPQNVTGVGGSPIDSAIETVTGIFQVKEGITPAGTTRDHRR